MGEGLHTQTPLSPGGFSINSAAPASGMPKAYDPEIFESRILCKWEDSYCFSRSPGTRDYTIVIPPPNVTGILHMGHALDDTIQDALIRFHRMRGDSTRWILGTDHAGIATQTKVDKFLAQQGVSRSELGRWRFLDACWDWTHEYGGRIISQIKRMGCSIDFSDPHFTMEPAYARAVRKVFCDWYHDGLIYRGMRIVNWCPHCTTAIADDEAEYIEDTGHLWHLRYPLKEPVCGHEYIVVATTRPETMLGDTGVAVSPDDPQKSAFVGATVILPILGREIPIFSDYYVEAGFGSGFVKVTPAHDPNDFSMGERHNLEKVNIFDETAHVVEGFGEFSGLSREECREAVLAWFADHDLLDHVDEHTHSVMHCYRCGTTLEPWLSEQWFVAVDRLKGPAIDAVESGKVKFYPKRWEDTYLTWMENLRDWCISRQLWWGHRIPVFYCDTCGFTDALMEDADTCPNCGGVLRQDEDVLDTWFSSQLWTFATQGWPDDLDTMSRHHPTSALVTARDIIALWVARMVMASLYCTGDIPFHDVVIYPTILAKDGSRMSKSKGNGVDPMDLIEMYGADAMRYNLLTLVTNNQDVRFDADIDKKTGALLGSPRTEQARAFVTKIWNASRFVIGNMDGFVDGPPMACTQADAWIFSRLARLSREVTDGISEYRFGDVTRLLHTFFWNEFCDWYIEFCKASLRGEDKARLQTQRNLVFVLSVALRLLHPAMPFVTEAIWEYLPHTAGVLYFLSVGDNRTFSHAAGEDPGKSLNAIGEDLASSPYASEDCAGTAQSGAQSCAASSQHLESQPGSAQTSGPQPTTPQSGAQSCAASSQHSECHPGSAQTSGHQPTTPQNGADDALRPAQDVAPHRDEFILMLSSWPEPERFSSLIDDDAEKAISLLIGVVSAVRSIRARYNIPPKQPIPVSVRANEPDTQVLSDLSAQITSMAGACDLVISSDLERPAQSAATVVSGCEVYCCLSGLVDFDAEYARLTKERKKLAADEVKFSSKLSNPGFLAKAAPEIIEHDKAVLADIQDTLSRLDAQITELGSVSSDH